MIPVRKFSSATELMSHYHELFERERRKQQLFERERRKQQMILNERSARREEARFAQEMTTLVPESEPPPWPQLKPLEKPKPDPEPRTDVPAPFRRMSMVKHIKWECVQGLFIHGEPMMVKDLEGPSRLKVVTEARQRAIYRCVTELGLSSPLAGRMFNRDHTTIMHAVKKMGGKDQ